jgi:tRNA 5-methylaminomethyl-2-thiouridine biosynthesis bifunctional protein
VSAPLPPLVPARLAFDEHGAPCPHGGRSDPVLYHADAARHVFLGGNDLLERWRDRTSFTVLQAGFGIGAGFLAIWRAAREDAHAPRRLHVVALEEHPFDAAALPRVHAGDALAAALVAQWPPLVSGLHRLHFDDGRITLTLALGDAAALVPRLVARFDALCLGGHAFAADPASSERLAAIARLARPGATAASASTAMSVHAGLVAGGFEVGTRAGLVAGGFEVRTRAGHGGSRDMLVARKPGRYVEPARDRRAVVIGAGLAGTSVAERLAARDWTVTVLERESGPARGASGNPAGVVQPVLNLADAPNARLSRAAFLYAVRRFRALSGIAWGAGGVLRLARDAAQQQRFAAILARIGAPADYARLVDAAEAGARAGHAVSGDGVWFEHGAWVSPPSLCAAWLDAHSARIERRYACRVTPGEVAAMQADALVIDATGAGLDGALPVAQVRGQVSYLPASATRRLDVAVTGDGYIAPMPGGGHCAGASFGHDDVDLAVRAAEHRHNLDRVARMLPGFAAGLDAATLAGRAGLRITTPDRVPAFGCLHERHAVATGLGARGLVWSPLCAEVLASQLEDEPLPVERDLADAIDPRRFAGRADPVRGSD